MDAHQSLSGSDLAALGVLGVLFLPPKSRLHPIRNARRQNIGPFADRVVCAADGFSCRRHAAAQELESVLLCHGRMEPQFNTAGQLMGAMICPMVQQPAARGLFCV